MKNHVHLSMEVTEKTDISKMMQGLQLAYNHYQRRKRGYVGHLWQGRFNSRIVESDKYLLALGIYIEKNPVQAGIVKYPIEYRWSSYRYYAIGEDDPLVDPDPLYGGMGTTSKERQQSYREMMAARLRELGLID